VAAPEADEAVPFEVAKTILGAARARAETAEDLRSDPPAFADKPFLRKLGLSGEAVSWTAELIHRGFSGYAGYAQEPVDAFVAARSDLEVWAEELERKVRHLERQVGAVARPLEGWVARKQTAKLLRRRSGRAPPAQPAHLSMNSNDSRCAAKGRAIPPAVADVNLTVGTGLD
jgi:hypothetical protein